MPDKRLIFFRYANRSAFFACLLFLFVNVKSVVPFPKHCT